MVPQTIILRLNYIYRLGINYALNWAETKYFQSKFELRVVIGV